MAPPAKGAPTGFARVEPPASVSPETATLAPPWIDMMLLFPFASIVSRSAPGPIDRHVAGNRRKRAEAQVDRTGQQWRELDRVAAAWVGVGEVDRLAERRTVPVERADCPIVFIDERRNDDGRRTALERRRCPGAAIDARHSSLVGRDEQGNSAMAPLSMAGLPASSAMVWVDPPLFPSAPSLGSKPTRLPFTPFVRPPEAAASSIRLLLPETVPAISPPGLP